MDLARFAERLRQERERRGLTQRELAQMCGFDTSQMSRYESSSREPSAPALAKISEVLNLSVDYLMGLSDDPHGQVAGSDLDPREREILEVFQREGWAGVARLSVEKLAGH